MDLLPTIGTLLDIVPLQHHCSQVGPLQGIRVPPPGDLFVDLGALWVSFLCRRPPLQTVLKNTNIESPFCVIKVSFLLQIEPPSLFCSPFSWEQCNNLLHTLQYPCNTRFNTLCKTPATPPKIPPATHLQHPLAVSFFIHHATTPQTPPEPWTKASAAP